MQTFIRAIASCAALFIANAALADGVPLFRPGPPALTATTTGLIASKHSSRNAVAVNPDENAINSTIITVQLEGKPYRFVGAKRTLRPSISPGKATAADDGGDLWEGTTAGGDRAMLAKSSLGFHAQFLLADGRSFQVFRTNGQMALFENVPKKARGYDDPPTPEMIEAARKREAARPK